MDVRGTPALDLVDDGPRAPCGTGQRLHYHCLIRRWRSRSPSMGKQHIMCVARSTCMSYVSVN